jgi:hypothetical protein
LSAALTLLATLLSTSLSGTTFTLFFCALLITGLVGAICPFLGWRWHISTKELANQIRARMPAAPTVQQVPPDPVTGPPPAQAALPPAPPAAPGVPPTLSGGQAGTPPTS